MKRVALNFAALAVIIGGGSYLASAANAQDTIQATCGECSGACCGYDVNGRCWAKDVCPVVEE
jgi:uncharacterized protein YbcC (UPF0753/DUF2309 family)